MIDINKKYRTTDGKEVIILFTELANDHYPILGVIKENNGWHKESWTKEGLYDRISYTASKNLIEIDERQELLDEAKRRYPIGTKFKTIPYCRNKGDKADLIEESKREPYFYNPFVNGISL